MIPGVTPALMRATPVRHLCMLWPTPWDACIVQFMPGVHPHELAGPSASANLTPFNSLPRVVTTGLGWVRLCPTPIVTHFDAWAAYVQRLLWLWAS